MGSAPAEKTVSKPTTSSVLPKGKAKRKCTALKRRDSLNTIEAKIEECNAKVQRLRTKLEDDLATRTSSETLRITLSDLRRIQNSPRVLDLNKLILKTNAQLEKLKMAQYAHQRRKNRKLKTSKL